jgi:hypothetical protein
MSNYLTNSTASSTYQTIANMSNYLTNSTASTTYQTIANMSNYLSTATASSTYQTIANMSNYITSSNINGLDISTEIIGYNNITVTPINNNITYK